MVIRSLFLFSVLTKPSSLRLSSYGSLPSPWIIFLWNLSRLETLSDKWKKTCWRMKIPCICADMWAALEISTPKLIKNYFITISSMIQLDSLLCSQWSRSNIIQNSLTSCLREGSCMGGMISQNQPSGTDDPGFMENRLFLYPSRCQALSEVWSAQQAAQTGFLLTRLCQESYRY